MKLFLLRPVKDPKWGYDKAHGFVVAAACADDARSMAAGQRGDEGEGFWMSQLHSTCVEIAKSTQLHAGVVIQDFHGG